MEQKPTGNRPQNRKMIDKERRKKRRRITAIVGAGIVAVVLGTAFAAVYTSSKSPSGGNPLDNIITAMVGAPEENILLIGNNARNPSGPLDLGTGGGQADILMIAHIDPKQHKVVLISIPRNVLFAQPQFNNPIPKIKSMFFIGAQLNPNQAAQLSVAAVQQLTGMKINHWIVTDFNGFQDAVNAVGGVRVDVPGRLYDPLHSGANLYPGWQTLNGQQALAFIRIRQNEASSTVRVNDFQRMDAEAQVLEALKHKLLSPGTDITSLGGLMATWKKDIATDMNTQDLTALAADLLGAKVDHVTLGNVGDSMQIASAPLPGINQENYITGAYYDVLSPEHIYAMLKPYGSTGSSMGLPPLPSPSNVPVQVYGSQIVVNELKAAGYPVTWMGAGNGTYPVQIMYPSGDIEWGFAVGRTLATGNGIVEPGSPDPNAVVVYSQ
ncbi:MAG: LCP family protein [Acidibacillus sp.]|nr:LCP family protein [Acidibacillus sp.]